MDSLNVVIQENPELDRKWEYLTPHVEKKVGFQVFGRVVFIKLPNQNDADFSLLNGRLDYIFNKDNKQLVCYININDSFNLPIDSYNDIVDLSETLKSIRAKYRKELPKSDMFELSFFSSELI